MFVALLLRCLVSLGVSAESLLRALMRTRMRLVYAHAPYCEGVAIYFHDNLCLPSGGVMGQEHNGGVAGVLSTLSISSQRTMVSH